MLLWGIMHHPVSSFLGCCDSKSPWTQWYWTKTLHLQLINNYTVHFFCQMGISVVDSSVSGLGVARMLKLLLGMLLLKILFTCSMVLGSRPILWICKRLCWRVISSASIWDIHLAWKQQNPRAKSQITPPNFKLLELSFIFMTSMRPLLLPQHAHAQHFT